MVYSRHSDQITVQKAVRQDAAEAVLVYIDLVTLARLANQSAPRALVEAAHMSDHPVLARIRMTLERSRLEQQSPWAGLDRLSDELDLPELANSLRCYDSMTREHPLPQRCALESMR